MAEPQHALHSMVRTGHGYVARCVCGWQGSPRMTPLDALEGQQSHVLVVPGLPRHRVPAAAPVADVTTS